jgi:diadenosine tetraphosphate (Ap4A) HIT family hydrolase
MTPDESTPFGPLLHRLVPAVKAATGVERVYYLALMERVDHFHIWLIPKKDEGDLRGPAYIAQQPPLTATLSEAEAMSQKIKAGFEAS